LADHSLFPRPKPKLRQPRRPGASLPRRRSGPREKSRTRLNMPLLSTNQLMTALSRKSRPSASSPNPSLSSGSKLMGQLRDKRSDISPLRGKLKRLCTTMGSSSTRGLSGRLSKPLVTTYDYLVPHVITLYEATKPSMTFSTDRISNWYITSTTLKLRPRGL